MTVHKDNIKCVKGDADILDLQTRDEALTNALRVMKCLLSSLDPYLKTDQTLYKVKH